MSPNRSLAAQDTPRAHKGASDSGPEPIGVGLLLLSLLLDGFTGPLQEKLRDDKRYHLTPANMMLASNCWACLGLLVVMALSHELLDSIKYA